MDINVIGEPPIKTASTLQVLDPSGEAFNLGIPKNPDTAVKPSPSFDLGGLTR